MPENPSQNCSEYQPTKAERKLLEVLLNPVHRLKSITEICEIAEISRRQYYNIFAKPEFAEHYKQESKRLVGRYAGPLINAFIKEAVRGSYQHGKVLLEMAGLYQETTRKEVTGAGGNPIENNVTVVSRTASLTKEQRNELLTQLRQEDDDPSDNLKDYLNPEITDPGGVGRG